MLIRQHYPFMEALENDKGGGADDPEAAAAAAAAAAEGGEADKGGEPTPEEKAAAEAAAADGGDKGKPAGEEAKGYWPEDWRERLAGGDEKTLNKLSRYAAPEDLSKALAAAQSKISSGNLSAKLSDNPTDEELAAYRKDNGIPESIDGYDVEVPPEQKESMDAVLTAMHEANLTPAQAKSMIGMAKERREAEEQALYDFGQDAKESCKAELEEKWGKEFTRNLNMAHNLLDATVGQEVKEALFAGTLADGTPIGSSPEILDMLVNLSIIHNPAGTIVPATGGDQMQGINDEIKTIETFMSEHRGAYDKDEKKQARLRDLYGAREALKPSAE